MTIRSGTFLRVETRTVIAHDMIILVLHDTWMSHVRHFDVTVALETRLVPLSLGC